MADEKSSSPLPRVVAAAMFVILAAIYFFHSRADKTANAPPPDASTAIANPAENSAPNGSTALPLNHANDPGMPQLDRAHADLIRQKLRELSPILPGQASATPTKTANEYPVMPHGEGADDPTLHDYIHQKIKDDYIPLAKSCYENALVKTPDMSGRLVMKFKIVGDKRVGGVVDSVDTDPETTMHDEKFLQCVTESMMSVSFDAPPNDGSVTVKYPLIFSPGDGGDSDSD